LGFGILFDNAFATAPFPELAKIVTLPVVNFNARGSDGGGGRRHRRG